MSTNLTVRDQATQMGLSEIMTLGDVFKASGYFQDVRDQAQAVVKILCGRELGFSPVVSMMGIHVIDGKPSLSANLMATLIKRSGKYDYRITSWTNEECVLLFRERVDNKWEDVGKASFSIDDAKRAKVRFEGPRGPSGWTKFPKAMLFARALSQGLRAYCPDVSAAPIYNPEEMGADINEEGDVIDIPPAKVTKSVERTVEDIPLTKSAAANNSQAVKSSKGREEPTHAADKDSTADNGHHSSTTVNDSSVHVAVAQDSGDNGKNASAPAVEYCTKEQQDWLRLEFKSALPPKYSATADKLRRDLLKDKGYMKPSGEGSSTLIPRADFKMVAKQCIKFARELGE